ncbi:MAG: MarR family transcriptional regulator [Dethiobacter sp.]|nr:MAG: MarR family transcriptional regulator [Dethiobacter sp.]
MAIIFIDKDTLGFIICHADLKMKNNLMRKIKSFDITTEQWMIMNRLFEEGGISQKELSERTLKDQGALTRTLDRMEKKGLVKRQVSPYDRRSFLIYLTDAGQAVRNRIVPIAVECIEEAVKGFTEEEVGTLTTLLKRVILNL